jgi:hypothetical protein
VVASIIFTKWGSLAWLIEEYMEDFLWLSQRARAKLQRAC